MTKSRLSVSVITRSDLVALPRDRNARLTEHLNSLIRYEMKFREFEFDRVSTQKEVHTLGRFITGDNILITLEDEAEVVGSVVIRPVQIGNETISHLGFLYIGKRYRRKGYAKMLMKHAETLSKQLGCKAIQLGVLANNEAAVEFYAAMEYKPMLTYLGKEL